MKRYMFSCLGIMTLLLAACGPAAEEATPTPAVTPTLTPLATPTPARGVTPTPTPKPAPTPTTAAVEPKYGGTLTTYIRRDPGFDPIRTGSALEARQLQHAVFSSLLEMKWPDRCEVETIGDAAKSWKWITDTTIEVKLIPGIKFHDKAPVNGRELVAEDVAYSFKRLMSPESLSSAKDYTQHVTAVEAVDRYTVRFHLAQPYAPFEQHVLRSQYGAIILAREAGGPKEDWSRPEVSYIGSGPFSLEKYTPGVGVVLAKNKDYFKKGVPHIDELRMLFMPDTSTRQAAFRAGKLDFIQDIPGPYLREIEKTMPNVSTARCGSGVGTGIQLRTDLPPFNDVRVRRAVSIAINREAMLSGPMGGMGEIYGLASSAMVTALRRDEFPPETRKYLEYHPDEARTLLAEAGNPEIEIWASTRWGYPRTGMFEAAIIMFGDAGFRIRQNRWMEAAAYINTVTAGNYPPAVVALGAVSLYSPYDQASQVYSKGSPAANTSRISDPLLDKLIEEFFRTYDEAKAAGLSRDIQIRTVDQAYMIVFPQMQSTAAWHTWVRNFGGVVSTPHYMRGLLERIWVER